MILNYQLVKEKKLKLKFPSNLFINGNYQKSISENFFDNISPIDGKIINQISLRLLIALAYHLEVEPSMTSTLLKKDELALIFLSEVLVF